MIILLKLKAMRKHSKDKNNVLYNVFNNILDSKIYKCIKIVSNAERKKELAIIYVETYNEDTLNILYNSFNLSENSIIMKLYTEEEFLNKTSFDYIDESLFNLTDSDLTDIKNKISNIIRA